MESLLFICFFLNKYFFKKISFRKIIYPYYVTISIYKRKRGHFFKIQDLKKKIIQFNAFFCFVFCFCVQNNHHYGLLTGHKNTMLLCSHLRLIYMYICSKCLCRHAAVISCWAPRTPLFDLMGQFKIEIENGKLNIRCIYHTTIQEVRS